MGVWPEIADGTDINAVDVSDELNVVAVADDFGMECVRWRHHEVCWRTRLVPGCKGGAEAR